MNELALPTVGSRGSQAPRESAEWLQAARRAKALSWLSLVWMGAEGAVAITAGIVAGSVALIGFGLDSAIEGFASLVIVWRFTGSRLRSEESEIRAQKLVALQFFLLAPLVTVEAMRHLLGGDHADVSVLGMALTASSVIGMPLGSRQAAGRAQTRIRSDPRRGNSKSPLRISRRGRVRRPIGECLVRLVVA